MSLLTRLWLASSALVFAGCLAAPAGAPNARMRAAMEGSAMEGAAAGGPSKFDFMVLASMADSPHLLAMAGYRPAPRQCAAHPADTVAPSAAAGRLPQCRL